MRILVIGLCVAATLYAAVAVHNLVAVDHGGWRRAVRGVRRRLRRLQ